jgi:hypothetical protein
MFSLAVAWQRIATRPSSAHIITSWQLLHNQLTPLQLKDLAGPPDVASGWIAQNTPRHMSSTGCCIATAPCLLTSSHLL